jgi:two-component system phosphate regulon response regulator PhoB
MRQSVALVDDDRNILASVSIALEAEGFDVTTYGDGDEALRGLTAQPVDLVVLDIKMPRLDGMELLGRLRQKSNLPVIFLTSKDDEIDEAMGLRLGADDYITKPFSMTELLARLRAVMRRVRPGLSEDVATIGDITMDRGSHRVRRAGRDIHLGPTEYRLLDHLMQFPGRVFSREQLLDAVWGSDVYVEARTVDVHVGRLRKALVLDSERDPIRTVRSAGYSFDETFGV